MTNVAQRLYFIAKPSDHGLIVEKNIEFTFFAGQSKFQKQKSIDSMIYAIRAVESGGNILEVSTKSRTPLGNVLSGFQLEYFDKEQGKGIPVVNIFEGSKVFEKGGPYLELLHCTPLEAKRDERLLSSGKLLGFEYEGEKYDLQPRSLFYDWIYLKALNVHPEYHEELLAYDIFTDIEYNMTKMFACQARSVAYFVSLYRKNLLKETMKDIDLFKKIYTMTF